ncbi:hypothetical protein LshimejAT787_2000190 [Lyophyllum shimeji]|uniref:Uncharacterized protein n=1 Tax=Lyophyllum shimeji TaxID=47721 RepID=A0A9P3URI2_LYOSH|nr:hypothetical protein LshimejAT787_2000190 [Lyophyllum shimeji]
MTCVCSLKDNALTFLKGPYKDDLKADIVYSLSSYTSQLLAAAPVITRLASQQSALQSCCSSRTPVDPVGEGMGIWTPSHLRLFRENLNRHSQKTCRHNVHHE